MTAQCYENTKKYNTKYEKSYQTQLPTNCPGSCTCNLGTRTQYDYIQYNNYVAGQHKQFNLVQRVPGWKI